MYEIYVCDTETTGLALGCDIIELSILRLSTGAQKTWMLKAANEQSIETGALRVNGHKLEDITHKTKYGRENYLDPIKVIVDIENWLAEDMLPAENRVITAHNTRFDYNMLEQLWIKCGSLETFPFGRRYLDTMQIQFFLDFCKDDLSTSYSLANLTKKYGLTNSKAHTAAADTLTTKDILVKQIDYVKKLLK